MSIENELVFGCRVFAGKVLKRRVTTKEIPNAIFYGANTRKRWKYWDEKSANIGRGLFLGFRTLSNGITYWEDECGYIFCPCESFKAALVCPGHNLNPVYVPLGAIELVKCE